jgi:hypothetical protein
VEFTGEFETHLTVALAPDQAVELLQSWATQRGLKCLHILLARGRNASQPMLTCRGNGRLQQQLAAAEQLRQQLNLAGFAVTRVKVEAATTNDDVPQSDGAANEQPPERYFEHHIKLLLPQKADLTALITLAQRHEAHLSRNALREQAGGKEERFVTQRCWSAGRTTAKQRLVGLVDELTRAEFQIIDVEEEFVIYDSNSEVDAGWLREE